MFEKVLKIQLACCGSFFLAGYAGAILGTIWMIEPWLNGVSEDFLYAPGMMFSIAALFAWAMGFDKLMCDTFCGDQSSLMMTLPVSEEVIVDSQSYTGTFGSCLMYLCIGGTLLYMMLSNDGLEATFTSLAALFVNASYSTWTRVISIGLIPMILLLEQVATSLLLLSLVLKWRTHKSMKMIMAVVCFAVLLLQVCMNCLVAVNCGKIIALVHPLILECGVILALVFGVIFLRKHAIYQLKYRYID